MFVKNTNTAGFSVKAWQGDAKTLIAFDFTDAAKASIENLAGFTIQVQPHGQPSYYLLNSLTLPAPAAGQNATVAGEPDNSSANAPFQKFRWLHVPGSFHQGENVYYGVYTYTITARYFDNNGLLIDINTKPNVVSVDVQVQPFTVGQVEMGFTRGFTQSQAFTHRFGVDASFRPTGKELLYDTTAIAGTNSAGQTYTFAQEYEWSGFTAREKIFNILNQVVADTSLTIDVFAYDLNEPDILKLFLQLAARGSIRIILDNASLHHKPGAAEDAFEKLFTAAAKGATAIQRGRFSRFAHDKVFIVYKNDIPQQVLTGSTNFSYTGMYVNSNHLLVFNSPDVAELYSKVFDEAWTDKVSGPAFIKSSFSEAPFVFNQVGLPKMSITFSPHDSTEAANVLDTVTKTIESATSSVLFAVMALDPGTGTVLPALQKIHTNQKIFSYGISDTPGNDITLYKPGISTGVLVTAKPGQTLLPPPFDKEKPIGIGHQVHHKFVICDFNTNNPVLWCGSSNLALGGEESNGDNLLQINDTDIATVFALEAIGLVDHFDFRDAHTVAKPKDAPKAPIAGKTAAPKALPAPLPKIYLYTNNSWATRYFDPNDLHNTDRLIFG